MGALTSRQHAGVEEVDVPAHAVYRYPPKSGERRPAAGRGGAGPGGRDRAPPSPQRVLGARGAEGRARPAPGGPGGRGARACGSEGRVPGSPPSLRDPLLRGLKAGAARWASDTGTCARPGPGPASRPRRGTGAGSNRLSGGPGGWGAHQAGLVAAGGRTCAQCRRRRRFPRGCRRRGASTDPCGVRGRGDGPGWAGPLPGSQGPAWDRDVGMGWARGPGAGTQDGGKGRSPHKAPVAWAPGGRRVWPAKGEAGPQLERPPVLSCWCTSGSALSLAFLPPGLEGTPAPIFPAAQALTLARCQPGTGMKAC